MGTRDMYETRLPGGLVHLSCALQCISYMYICTCFILDLLTCFLRGQNGISRTSCQVADAGEIVWSPARLTRVGNNRVIGFK